MFYILLCFYLWIYGTLNKISYQPSTTGNILQMTAAPLGHSKSGMAWEVGRISVKFLVIAVCSGEVVTLHEESNMRKLQEFVR